LFVWLITSHHHRREIDIFVQIFLQVISKKKKAWYATAKHIKDITIPYIGIGITLPDKKKYKPLFYLLVAP
jgi:hypothetical protein